MVMGKSRLYFHHKVIIYLYFSKNNQIRFSRDVIIYVRRKLTNRNRAEIMTQAPISPVVLVILDGWGYREKAEANAIGCCRNTNF